MLELTRERVCLWMNDKYAAQDQGRVIQLQLISRQRGSDFGLRLVLFLTMLRRARKPDKQQART